MNPEFDRDINVRGIIWTGVALAAGALLVHLLIWWLLRGISSLDEKRDARLTPIEISSPQQPPPEPRLQISPNADMDRMRAEEDRLLRQAGWVDPRQGIVRVPIDVAIDVIAARGVSSQVVGGTGAAPAPGPGQPATQPGANVQMARPPAQ